MLLIVSSLPSNSEKISEDFNTWLTNGREKNQNVKIKNKG